MIQRVKWIGPTPLNETEIHGEDFYALVDYASTLGRWNTCSSLLNCLCGCFKKAREEFNAAKEKSKKDEKEFKQAQEKFDEAWKKHEKDEKNLKKLPRRSVLMIIHLLNMPA